MEKLIPYPDRAIAFIQMQLCQVLSKQGYTDEAILVLSKALTFHSDKVRFKLRNNNKGNNNDEVLIDGGVKDNIDKKFNDTIIIDQTIYDDVKIALELNARLIQMLFDTGATWQAADQAETIISLVEISYGWDSLEYAKCKKDAGIQCAATGDWTRAVNHFKDSVESYETIYGKKIKEQKNLLNYYQMQFQEKKKVD